MLPNACGRRRRPKPPELRQKWNSEKGSGELRLSEARSGHGRLRPKVSGKVASTALRKKPPPGNALASAKAGSGGPCRASARQILERRNEGGFGLPETTAAPDRTGFGPVRDGGTQREPGCRCGPSREERELRLSMDPAATGARLASLRKPKLRGRAAWPPKTGDGIVCKGLPKRAPHREPPGLRPRRDPEADPASAGPASKPTEAGLLGRARVTRPAGRRAGRRCDGAGTVGAGGDTGPHLFWVDAARAASFPQESAGGQATLSA